MTLTTTNYNIIFIGYRGVGKTTIADALSQKIKRDVISTDKLIAQEAAMEIPDIVSTFGWRKFREIESKIIKRVSQLKKTIIDCGGGVVENDSNITSLKQNGKVILLVADFKDIISRMSRSNDRPSLENGLTIEEETKKVLEKRNPLYEKYADLKINTSRADITCLEGINIIVDEIIQKMTF